MTMLVSKERRTISITNFERTIDEKIIYLDKLIQSLDSQIAQAPIGYLRIDIRNGNVNYYHCIGGKDNKAKHGTFVRKDNLDLVYQLAQKSYNQKVRQKAVSMRETLVYFRRNYCEDELMNIYEALPETRKKLVISAFLTEDEFAENWKAQKFDSLSMEKEDENLISENGEIMRSKSEVMIASLLNKYGVPYRYEESVLLDNGETVYPDFHVLNKRTRKEFFWEHLGKMDDEDYVNRNLTKIDAYAGSNISVGNNLILTFETGKRKLNLKTCEHHIKTLLI